MKAILLLPLLIVASLFSTAQVGIRTPKPTADLHIVSNPTPGVDNYNGVIIPKVVILPVTGAATFPKPAQAGLLVYLESSDLIKNGIYIFDGAKYIKLEPAAASGAFYNNSTTNFATNTTANVQRTGNVSLGSNLNSGRLNLEILSGELVSNAPEIGLRIANANKTTAVSTATYGILNENTSAAGIKYGIRNVVSGNGNGNRTGIDSDVTPSSADNILTIGIQSDVANTPSGASNATVYGFTNFIGVLNGNSKSFGFNTRSGFGSTVSQTNYGVFTEVGISSSRGTKYGVYSLARNTGDENAYSGYFRGDKFAIRSQDDANGYDLPTVDGFAGQVLTTNGSKVASWQYASNISNIRTITGGTLLTTDATVISTGNVIVPAASTANIGKKYVIALGSANNLEVTSNAFFNPGSTGNVTTINLKNNANAPTSITIQSDGARWIIITKMSF